jgi:hypothetical protein
MRPSRSHTLAAMDKIGIGNSNAPRLTRNRTPEKAGTVRMAIPWSRSDAEPHGVATASGRVYSSRSICSLNFAYSALAFFLGGEIGGFRSL